MIQVTLICPVQCGWTQTLEGDEPRDLEQAALDTANVHMAEAHPDVTFEKIVPWHVFTQAEES